MRVATRTRIPRYYHGDLLNSLQLLRITRFFSGESKQSTNGTRTISCIHFCFVICLQHQPSLASGTSNPRDMMADEIVNLDAEPEVEAKKADSLSNQQLAELKKEEANKFYNTKQYDKALALYSEVIALCPEIARYYGNRAACYMMIGRYKDALNDAKKCVEVDPKFIKAYVRIIKCSLILGDTVSAESTLNKVLELDPTFKPNLVAEQRDLEHLRRYEKEAEVAYNAKDYRKVVYCMDRCCDVSTSCPRFKLTKAECLAFLGRYLEAQDLANDILHFDKQNADAIYVRGMCLYYEDNVDNAFAHFQQVLRLAPDHNKALDIYKRAKSLKQKKEKGNDAFKNARYTEAYDLYTEALTIDPQNAKTNAKLYFNKAMVSAKLGKHQQCVEECTHALKLDENYLKALMRRASSYMELEQFEEAVYDYEKICKLNRTPDNKRFLAKAKLALKQSKRKDYYKILGVDKNASTDDIKKAYRKRAMVHHPDRHADASAAEMKEQEKKFKEVGEAYGILSDPKKRSRYDSGHSMDDSGPEIDPNTMFYSFFGSNFDDSPSLFTFG